MMEHFYKGEVGDFERIWRAECGEALPGSERLYPGNVQKILEHWMQAQREQKREFTISHTEQILEASIGDIDGEEVIYYGTLDAIMHWSNGQWVMDHKTTGNMGSDWEEQWSMSAQMIGYVWLARANGFAVRGAFINGLEIRLLPPWDGKMTKKCSVHKMTYEHCQPLHIKHAFIGPLVWSQKRIDQWRVDVLAAAKRLLHMREYNVNLMTSMRHIQQNGQFIWPGCSRCMYKPFCLADRPVAGIAQMMEHEPWRVTQEGEEE
jgi:hypothetical protein